MKHIKTFESFINESSAINFVDKEHKDFVDNEGLGSYPVPNNLKELIGKTVKVVKHIKYEFGDSPAHGSEGIIKHAYLDGGDTIYVVMGDDEETFEAMPDEVKILESLNEAASSFIEDSGTLRTKIGNLKYEVKGGLDRGGNLGSYQISDDSLSRLIDSINMNAISKILGDNGIELAARPSEFELNLSNSGLGHNGLTVIIPEISFPVKLSKDYPAKERGWVITKEEYAIYGKIMSEVEKIAKGKGYRIHLKGESSSYGSTINDKDPKITITFEQGSLS